MSPFSKVTQGTKTVLSWRGFIGVSLVYCPSSVVAHALTGARSTPAIMRRWCGGIVRDLGIDVETHDLDKLAGPASIIVANHCSLLDIPVLGSQFDIDYRWVAKKSLFKVPLVGWHLWGCGHIPVDRKKSGNLERMQEHIEQVLAQGRSVVFFAEGTRSSDGALQKFRAGAFLSAVKAGVPVLPVVLDGTEKLLVKGSLEFPKGPKNVRMRVLDRIEPPTDGELRERADALRDVTRARMVEGLDALRGGPGLAEQPTI